MFHKSYVYLICFLLLTSCGYRFGHGGKLNDYRTIEVPYVVGDQDGSLTAAIIRELSVASPYKYVSCGGDIVLEAEILEVYHDNVGFRFERNPKGTLIKDLVPAETRLYAVFQVQVIDPCRGCALLGPVRMKAYVDFDHDYYASPDEINVFSLGQVVDVDTAFDSAQAPLNKVIAEKITAFISDSW